MTYVRWHKRLYKLIKKHNHDWDVLSQDEILKQCYFTAEEMDHFESSYLPDPNACT